jgi:pyruvate dehydrogenase E2 component (dihydrolipoamide acetyltransferase)
MTDEGLALLPEINVGLAVALEEGLVVPVVRGADRFSIADLATETSRLASAARSGKLELADVEGGTFSVTALGMFGVDGFTPVINPPNTAVLGIGRIRDQATWNEKGRIKKAQVLTLSLTWDHRAFDGAPAARFVSTIRNFLEEAQFGV